MWTREKLGTRINGNRTEEAVATGADQIAVACPLCPVLLSDALTSQQAAGSAPESVEVVDVAQMLPAAGRREPPPDPASPTLACRSAPACRSTRFGAAGVHISTQSGLRYARRRRRRKDLEENPGLAVDSAAGCPS